MAESDVVRNKNGWVQGSLNCDGSLKDPADINFTEPGTEAPEAGVLTSTQILTILIYLKVHLVPLETRTNE
jgi:hypothetical protein